MSRFNSDCGPNGPGFDPADVDDKYIDYLNEKYTGDVLKRVLAEYYEGLSCLKKKPRVYRIDVRPLWKNNSPTTFMKLVVDIMGILQGECGNSVWWEETTKCFKFALEDGCMQMSVIIAIQAIGHNNGGYSLGYSVVL